MLIAIGFMFVTSPSKALGNQEWQELKSQHFIVMYSGDQAFAEKFANRAEQYYQQITTDLGFTRFKDFWLWDHRARIVIYPSVAEFRSASKAPSWAIGRASVSRHEIAGSRDDSEHFLSNVLPHEMSHLILAEFIGADRLPHWLSEGVAQWEQAGNKANISVHFRLNYIPLEKLFVLDIRKEQNTAYAMLFYAECASLVGYLINQYGSESFGRLCRALREGKSTTDAISSAYPDTDGSIAKLEAAWLKSQKTSK